MSLCQACQHLRVITSGKGSRFFLCEQSFVDQRFPKYPPQPVVRCTGFVPRADEPQTNPGQAS